MTGGFGARAARLVINLKTAVFVVSLLSLGALNYYLARVLMLPLGTPKYFPVSIVSIRYNLGLRLSVGLIAAAVFVLLLYMVISRRLYLKGLFAVWLIGVSFLAIGNFAQGGFYEGFVHPLTAAEHPFTSKGSGGIDYYHDAVKIDDWRAWLGEFNSRQPELLEHTKSHPPGAVLAHYFLMRTGSDSVLVLGFVFITSLSVILVYYIFQTLGAGKDRSLSAAALFSLVPAYNIYGATSLDGVILTAFTLTLLGMLRARRDGLDIANAIMLSAGITVSGHLSFGSAFLWAVLIGAGLYDYIVNKNSRLLWAFALSAAVFVAVAASLKPLFSFDYLQAFLTASRIENPEGFVLTSNPLKYVMTRLENAYEVLLFLSLGVLSALIGELRGGVRRLLSEHTVPLAGVLVIVLMWLAGAYRTGETARAALFIFPYLMLFLKDLKPSAFGPLMAVTGLQAILMQLAGYYRW